MERRKAITTAAAASLTLLAGAAGIALNSGIVGARGDTNVGQLSPVTTAEPPITVYVDDPTTAPLTAAPRFQSSNSQPVTTSTASAYWDDDRDEREDDGRDEHESDAREAYEGAEDDD
jgi:hypothetical protein